ncbi:MAG: hypothetical protein ICV55_03480 [Coleofasciculus sp. C3-bin4]|nr:hypothetical protein [Coleofasciculus sp. C3-bin4]
MVFILLTSLDDVLSLANQPEALPKAWQTTLEIMRFLYGISCSSRTLTLTLHALRTDYAIASSQSNTRKERSHWRTEKACSLQP